MGKNIISWCAKKQHTVLHSSTEVEYRAMANTAAKLTWLTFILKDLHIPMTSPLTLYCDNLSALHMTINPVFHARSKHIELDYHFVQDRVALGQLITKHISINEQVADLLTKPMSKAALTSFQNKLCLQPKHSLRESVSSRHSDGSNYGMSRWSDKMTQEYRRNKDEHSHSAVSNIPRISG